LLTRLSARQKGILDARRAGCRPACALRARLFARKRVAAVLGGAAGVGLAYVGVIAIRALGWAGRARALRWPSMRAC